METPEFVVPKDFVIEFKEDQKITLMFKGESNGVVEYTASFRYQDGMSEGQMIRLICTIEYSLLAEKEKQFYKIN